MDPKRQRLSWRGSLWRRRSLIIARIWARLARDYVLLRNANLVRRVYIAQLDAGVYDEDYEAEPVTDSDYSE